MDRFITRQPLKGINLSYNTKWCKIDIFIRSSSKILLDLIKTWRSPFTCNTQTNPWQQSSSTLAPRRSQINHSTPQSSQHLHQNSRTTRHTKRPSTNRSDARPIQTRHSLTARLPVRSYPAGPAFVSEHRHRHACVYIHMHVYPLARAPRRPGDRWRRTPIGLGHLAVGDFPRRVSSRRVVKCSARRWREIAGRRPYRSYR